MAAKQMNLFKKQSLSYGGDLLTKRKGRLTGRPLSTKHCMHLTLRSTKAHGRMSFLRFKKDIREILQKFAAKNGIQLVSLANVGNHLHLQIKLSKRENYRPFIRAVTAAIAMKVSGRNRWTAAKDNLSNMSKATELCNMRKATEQERSSERSTSFVQSKSTGRNLSQFWDRRPFSRIVVGYQAVLSLKDYIRLNQFEGMGYPRSVAKVIAREGSWFERPGNGLGLKKGTLF